MDLTCPKGEGKLEEFRNQDLNPQLLGVKAMKWSALFIFMFSKCNGCSVDSADKKPVITALLDLHTGENCEIVNFHGIQQLAILQSTLAEINSIVLPDGMEIKFLFFDTCSTTTGTKIATLNALVAAEQTCRDTPFFLGFIGNENRDGFEISQGISNVFNIAHVLPHSFDLNYSANDNAHFISSYPVRQHTEAVKIIFDKLGVQNFIILYENISLSILKLNHLIEELKEDLCFMKTVAFVSLKDLKHQINQDSNEDGLLILIENPNFLDELSVYLMTYKRQIIISAGKVGSENFLFPLLKSTFILQFVSSSPLGNLSQQYDENLVKTYDEQQLLKCIRNADKLETKCISSITKALNIKEKDWTVDLLQYGLMLYGKSVGIAANRICNQQGDNKGWCSKLNSMTQKEWHHTLQSATLDSNKIGSSTKKIKFNMDIIGTFFINLLEDGSIRSIGQIEGSKIQMANDYKFPTFNSKKHSKCFDAVPSSTTTTTSTLPTTTKFQIETSLIPLEGFFDIDLRDYEMIGILSGIVFGIVFLLSLFVYVVYATVRVKSARSDSSSIGSENTRLSD